MFEKAGPTFHELSTSSYLHSGSMPLSSRVTKSRDFAEPRAVILETTLKVSSGCVVEFGRSSVKGTLRALGLRGFCKAGFKY